MTDRHYTFGKGTMSVVNMGTGAVVETYAVTSLEVTFSDHRFAPAPLPEPSPAEYGIVANVIETDRVLRKGAKVWLVGGDSGGGWAHLEVNGLARNGRPVTKVLPITRLDNFRAAWMPEHVRPKIGSGILIRHGFSGTREEMAATAKGFAENADLERAAHPNRRAMALKAGIEAETDG